MSNTDPVIAAVQVKDNIITVDVHKLLTAHMKTIRIIKKIKSLLPDSTKISSVIKIKSLVEEALKEY